MAQTRRGDLTLRATAGLRATVLDIMATPATPAYPKKGHQPTNMHNNIMGGSTANKDWTPTRTT
jgi:hypothetical protein